MRIIKPSHEILTEIDSKKIISHLEVCGRTCYKSEDLITDESGKKFIKSIIKSHHDSVLEHISITVKFITSRAVLAQLTRHRLNSFSVESQRYCNYNKDKFNNGVTFIQPTWVEESLVGDYEIKWMGVYGADVEISSLIDKPTNRWFWNCAVSERDYLRLIHEGWSPEQAREVLNNSTKTEIMMTANLRQWRAIFNQRCKMDAQSEIRNLMDGLLKELQEKLPSVFEDLKFSEGE